MLQKRQKWLKIHRNFKVGDLVLVVDENLHRNDWKFGRIVSVDVSSDGLVRKCVLQTQSGAVLERPIAKLCMMESAL